MPEETLVFDSTAASYLYAGYVESGGSMEPGLGFSAALFHALRYMWFGGIEQRWERIAYAVRHEADLTDTLRVS